MIQGLKLSEFSWLGVGETFGMEIDDVLLDLDHTKPMGLFFGTVFVLFGFSSMLMISRPQQEMSTIY